MEEKISEQKVVAVNINSGGPWMREIEKRLKKAGFRVLRASSVNDAIEVSGKKIIKYNDDDYKFHRIITIKFILYEFFTINIML